MYVYARSNKEKENIIMVGSYSNQCDFYLLSFFCSLKKNEHGWFTLKPITLVCAYIFLLIKEKRIGLVRTQTNHIVFAYFVFSLRKSRASLNEWLRTIYKPLDKILANVANTSVQSL